MSRSRRHAIRRARERRKVRQWIAEGQSVFYESLTDGGNMAKGKTQADLFDGLAGNEVKRGADFWKPEPGEMIAGIYTAKQDTGKYGPVAKIQTPSGNIVPVGMNAVLEDLLHAGLVGEPVAIQFAGEESTGKANPMKVYRVKQLSVAAWESLQQDSDLPF